MQIKGKQQRGSWNHFCFPVLNSYCSIDSLICCCFILVWSCLQKIKRDHVSQFSKPCMRPNTLQLPAFRHLIVQLMDFPIFEVNTMPKILLGQCLTVVYTVESLILISPNLDQVNKKNCAHPQLGWAALVSYFMLSKSCVHCECHYIDCMLDHTKQERVTRTKVKSWPYNFKGKKKRKIKLPSEPLLYLHTLRLIKSYASEYMADQLVSGSTSPYLPFYSQPQKEQSSCQFQDIFLSFFPLIHLLQKL